MNVFILEAPMKTNTPSEYIGTTAAMYGCKMLQLYE